MGLYTGWDHSGGAGPYNLKQDGENGTASVHTCGNKRQRTQSVLLFTGATPSQTNMQE